MVDCDGKWTNDEIRAVLRDTSKDLGDKGKDNLFGYGLLNLDFPHNPSSVETASSAKENYIGPVQLKAAWFTLRITLQPAI